MAWKIEFDPAAAKELNKFDRQIVKRVLKFLYERVARMEDPRSIGEALKGARLGEFWKYRVGDHRIIARIEDGKLTILVLKVGNRRDVYR
jgi:mRNA interferase RelE/StbE